MPDTFKPIQAERLYEQIVGQIQDRIINGQLQPGDKLPTENELVIQFGVSRTVVRDAMRILSLMGLIDIQPGRGTYVIANAQLAIKHSLDIMMKLGHEEGTRAVVGVREIIEPEIAALASTMAKDKQILSMREAVAHMDELLTDIDAFVESDLDFHLALAEATQNPIIPILIVSIIDILREERKRTANTVGGLQRGQYYHKCILKAIEERDPDAARKAMREHLNQVREDSERYNHELVMNQ
jgi:GntR family transcriptional regulator, transcriptional repressor for pyruvate dehydrogenase complex